MAPVILAFVLGGALTAAPAGGEDGPGPDLTAAVQGLAARLHVDRVRAREELIRAGARAIPALRQALESPDRTARYEAARALGRIGGEAAQEALEQLLRAEAAAARRDPWLDPSLAYYAALAMCRTGAAGMSRLANIAAGRVPELAAIRHQAYRAAIDILEPEIIETFQRAYGGGSYPGRFAELQKYGPTGVRKLAEIARSADPAKRDDRESHAQLAIQALGDIDLPEVVPALEALAADLRRSNADERVLAEVAHSLFRRGAPKLLEELISDLERRLRPVGGFPIGSSELLERLGLRYLHAQRYEDAIRAFGRQAMNPRDYGVALYNTACAYSRWGKPATALAELRRAISAEGGRTHYREVDWMQKDGDLIAARTLPGFDYVVACCIVRDRIGHQAWHQADPAAVREALDALRRAHERGYRIEQQDDRESLMLGGLRHHPEFERLWAAMGGTIDDDGR